MTNSFPHHSFFFFSSLIIPCRLFPAPYKKNTRNRGEQKLEGGIYVRTPGKFVSDVLYFFRIYIYIKRIYSPTKQKRKNVIFSSSSSLSQLENSATLSTKKPPRRLWSSRHLHPQQILPLCRVVVVVGVVVVVCTKLYVYVKYIEKR